jgi:hypothetical protein
MTPEPTLTDEELAELHDLARRTSTTMYHGVGRLIAAYRAERTRREHYEHVLADYECRLVEADATLREMKVEAATGAGMLRLDAKAEGVRLALSYLREEFRPAGQEVGG